jgi:hypothetical protein
VVWIQRKERRQRPRRVVRGRARGRSFSTRATPFLVEGLESRLLLSLTPEPVHVFAAEFSSPSLVAVIHHELATTPAMLKSYVSSLQGSSVSPIELTPVLLTRETTPPMVVFIQPRVATEPAPVSAGLLPRLDPAPPIELSSPTDQDLGSTTDSVSIGVTSIETSQPTSIARALGNASYEEGASSSLTTGSATTSSPSHSTSTTTSNTSGSTAVRPTVQTVAPVAPSPAPAVPSALPSVATGPVPGTKPLDVQGTLDASRQSESIEIPLDSSSESLGLTVQQTPNASSGSAPEVTNLILLNSSGSPLEEVSTGAFGQAGLAQSLSVALSGAAAGGRLVVQISTANASSSAGGSDASESSAADSSVPFVLLVQRLSSNTSAGGQLDQATSGSLMVLTVTTSASVATGATSLGVTTAANDNSTPASATPTQSVSLADVGSTAAGDDGDDGFSPRMPIGPLASRSAGPMAPTLATVDSDPAPPVDRHEIAFLQDVSDSASENSYRATEIADSKTATDVELTLPTYDSSAPLAAPAIRATEIAEPVVAVRGGGGLPLKVTGLGRGPHADSAALLSALPPAPKSAGESEVETALLIGPPAVEPHARMAAVVADPLECPDFVKAAIGLAIGLGLAAGPVFSDLIVALPSRGARRLRTLWARASGAGPLAGSGPRARS